MGDARYNMGNSLMIGCAKMGMHFVACAPKKYWPDTHLVETCREIAKGTGASIEFIEDPMEATKDANAIYTDVWVSMGEPDEVWAERIKDLMEYQVSMKYMENAADDAVFMHCLPAFHDLETKIGRLEFSLTASTAALVSYGSFIVSIITKSTPYLTPSFTVFEKISTAFSKIHTGAETMQRKKWAEIKGFQPTES